jgi:hypothetical protein
VPVVTARRLGDLLMQNNITGHDSQTLRNALENRLRQIDHLANSADVFLRHVT